MEVKILKIKPASIEAGFSFAVAVLLIKTPQQGETEGEAVKSIGRPRACAVALF